MFLRSVIIKNYRSLEDVQVERLERFNVLIGRNNSGKSSVFGAVQFLFGSMGGNAPDWERVLTDLDTSRALEMILTFAPRQKDREEFIDLASTTEAQKSRRAEMLDSPLMRQIEYAFKSPLGQPHLLHLRHTRVLTENNVWAVVQQMGADELTTNPNSTIVDVNSYGERYNTSGFVLNDSLLDINILQQGGLDGLTTEVTVLNVMQEAIAVPHTFSPSANLWPLQRLARYLSEAFFFDPFRHSVDSAGVQQTDQLGQDGSNLAQVLHTINSNDRFKFEEIEQFVQMALPDIGSLQTPLEGSSTRVSFRRPPGGYPVRLHDMGGGIEQLLMVATVLQTTGDENTLFLEEPESHLHAGAQRYLIERLYSGNRQVFVATHSPTFVNLSRPRSLYQVTYAGGRTAIQFLKDADSFGAMLEDIGARNSDLLLSDAVLFVEGPSDKNVLRTWSETLGKSLEECNVTVLPMGGGDDPAGKARVRSEILEGISANAPVPHLLVLDSDERSPTEVERLQRSMREKIVLLERREIENYLLTPQAILEALQEKHSDNATIMRKVEETSVEQVQRLIETSADSLYGLVLLKRIRAALEGLKGGILPRHFAVELATQAHDADLPRILEKSLESRVNDYLDGVDMDAIVHSEREALDSQWSEGGKRVHLAPGEEILAAVFNHFGSEYRKPGDTIRIAKRMNTDEIASEIQELIDRVISLPMRR